MTCDYIALSSDAVINFIHEIQLAFYGWILHAIQPGHTCAEHVMSSFLNLGLET